MHDRVVLRRVDSESKTSGGIIIPDTAAEKPQEGEVISVGPGARGSDGKIVPLDLKKGDRVLFGKWSCTEGKIDGAEILIEVSQRPASPTQLDFRHSDIHFIQK
jgi:chaperonin GroES